RVFRLFHRLRGLFHEALGTPLRQRQLVVHVLDRELDRHADPHLGRVDPEDVPDDPYALGKFHHGDDEGRGPAGHRRVVVHDVAVDLAAAGGDGVRAVQRVAGRADRARRVTQRAAVRALLDAQLAVLYPVPEELR